MNINSKNHVYLLFVVVSEFLWEHKKNNQFFGQLSFTTLELHSVTFQQDLSSAALPVMRMVFLTFPVS